MRKIPIRSRRCTQDGTFFNPGDIYLSALVEQKDAWLRQDFCQKCAEQLKPQGHFWKGVIPEKETVASPEDGSLIAVFKKFYAQDHQQSFAYLFALYLERKGIFARRGRAIFEELQSGEVFHLQPVEVKPEMARQLSEILEAHACPSV
ncbi:MAG: hypothetical protein JSS62_00780 [Verrucomicrobia bacterium]|nr:hypothetical protein [Verrucomicrobiota bacterium]MBS0645953.1 hypothetical protein [Verrucomicrobiota bacterium]